ncbi:hypothetical protein AYL99_00390 [Fonsecaea erecta]|uniref:Uncharacterized protein n=1 Tax=Fonsecaea erecta TaxID=1367422 RepID=A0A178ZX58_9EURO|nr:hypothetical protein AYL99_00390 [Fonsecaea erecta]OAP64418.1 hypothetical protein AYL99_00390 [Fonsecaea erecta]
MPAIKSTFLAMLAVSAAVAVALPSPQTATDDAPDAVSLHLEVQCGCWNLCTLEALGDASITGCDSTCDPQFLCETIDAQTGGPTTIVAATATPAASASASDNSKRDGSHGGMLPPPFNPFGPGGEFETMGEDSQPTKVKGKAKRALNLRPPPVPTIPSDPPFPGYLVKVKRTPERPIKPWPACEPGEANCPPVFELGTREAPSTGERPVDASIINPCPQGVVCEAAVVGKRDPEPLPPINPFPCPHGPDCPPPPIGDAWKRSAAEPSIPVRTPTGSNPCPPDSSLSCDPPILTGGLLPSSATTKEEKRDPKPQTPEFPDLDDTGRYPKHKIPRGPLAGDGAGGFEKRRINWDLTIKGTCNGGGCGGEVSVTIHF